MSTTAPNEVTTDQLLADLKTVMNDAEALLRATSTQTGEKIQEVRARAEESLRQAKARLSSFKVPTRWRIIGADDVPMTTTGKVDKAGLQQLFDKD